MSDRRRVRRIVQMPSAVRRGTHGEHNVSWYTTEREADDAVVILESVGAAGQPGQGRRKDLDVDELFAVVS